MPDTSRRYVVHGRMPLKRSPQSGLYTTRFKEDAFFIDFSERAVLFNSGARTEQSLQLPLYFVEAGYYQRKLMVDSVGFTGALGRLELFIQYALLPLLDPISLEDFRKEVLEKADAARKRYIKRPDHQALLDMLMLNWCDEPVTLFEYNPEQASLRVRARAPLPPKPPVATRTKRGRLNYYREYEDLLCSKAAFYTVNAFETLRFLQQVEVTLERMEAEPVNGLVLVEEDAARARPDFGLRRIDPLAIPPEETPKERKEREKAAREREKAEAARLKSLSKEKQKIAFSQRDPDPADSLFDGSLPHHSVLLSSRVERKSFMQMQRSKQSYSARHALELFELRLQTNEENSRIGEVESFF